MSQHNKKSYQNPFYIDQISSLATLKALHIFQKAVVDTSVFVSAHERTVRLDEARSLQELIFVYVPSANPCI